MAVEKSHPDIFEYHDYRNYLRDAFAWKRARNPAWTTVAWSRRLKLSAPSTLNMILNRKRHPGGKVMESLISYFKFNESEARYFTKLVGLQKKMGDQRLSVFLMKSLLAEKGQAPARVRNSPVLLRRHTYVLREMTRLGDFSEDPKTILKRLLTPSDLGGARDIEELLKELERQGLLVRDAQGNLTGSGATLSRERAPDREQVERFHFELLDAARGAITQVPREERLFHSTFLSVKKDRIEEARKLVHEFQKRFSELMESTPGDEVYQLNVHFFPATRKS